MGELAAAIEPPPIARKIENFKAIQPPLMSEATFDPRYASALTLIDKTIDSKTIQTDSIKSIQEKAVWIKNAREIAKAGGTRPKGGGQEKGSFDAATAEWSYTDETGVEHKGKISDLYPDLIHSLDDIAAANNSDSIAAAEISQILQNQLAIIASPGETPINYKDWQTKVELEAKKTSANPTPEELRIAEQSLITASKSEFFFAYDKKTGELPDGEKDYRKRAENASVVATAIEQEFIEHPQHDASGKIIPNYSFGVLSQYRRLLEQAKARSADERTINFLTAVVTSAAEECISYNPQVFGQLPNVATRLEQNTQYYTKNGDPIRALTGNILKDIGYDVVKIPDIMRNIHPHRLVAFVGSMGKISKNPEYVSRVLQRVVVTGLLSGEETNAIRSLSAAGMLIPFQHQLASEIGVTEMVNPSDFMGKNMDDIIKLDAQLDPNDARREACRGLTAFGKDELAQVQFHGLRDQAMDFLKKNWAWGMVAGIVLQMLQAQFDKDERPVAEPDHGGQPG